MSDKSKTNSKGANDASKQVQTPEFERVDKSPTEVHLDISVPADQFEDIYTKELKDLAKEVEIKGFRKGKAPLDMVEKSKGREVLESTLRKLMPVLTISVLKEEDLQPVIPVTYKVLSIDDKESIKFRAIVALIPDVKIPDLSKIDVEKESTEVEDKEVESVIKRLWEDHRGDAKNKDDKWVKSITPKLGFEASTMDELKKEVKKAVKAEKERISHQNYHGKILKAAVEMADVEVPEAAVHFEMEEREKTFNQQLEQMNISAEQFCQIRNTSMEELRKQWHKDSHDALENDVFLSKYAEDRDIEVTEEELKEEVERIKSRSPEGSDEKMFTNPQWRAYIRRVLLKRKAFQSFIDEVEEKTGKKSKKKEDKKKDKKSSK